LTRLVAVAVFGLLTLAAINHLDAGHPSAVALLGRSAYAVLLILQVGAFASQPPPTARDGRAGVWLVTLTATFGMVLAPSLPPLGRIWTPGPAQVWGQAILGVVGMGIALWAMASLGKSFSLTPQVRRLAATGPYRLLRHPLYLGEALNIVGIMVATGSLTVVAAAVLVVAGEAIRAVLEERLLRQSFPDYDTVFAGVAHLVPGVW
jgi:protein-S-isoprenylcysteine O-methyltransferase Ste14